MHLYLHTIKRKKGKGGNPPKKHRGQLAHIKPNTHRINAVILGAMRQVTPEDSGTIFHHIRKTATGSVLLALEKCDDRTKLQEAFKKVVGEWVPSR